MPDAGHTETAIAEAARHFRVAAGEKKCWKCGCLHDAVDAVLGTDALPENVRAAAEEARGALQPRKYDCIECQECYPALALNALHDAGLVDVGAAACLPAAPAQRAGWPPLPGDYTVLRYQAPVAVCTLANEALRDAVADSAGPEVAIVGLLHTENLGIEHLITNVIANPHIRFLLVCGVDSQQAVGHLPGQSLVALAEAGLDAQGGIIGARGKRPHVRNVTPEAVAHFRQTVQVVDRIASDDVAALVEVVRACAEHNPGLADAFDSDVRVHAIRGALPQRMTPDPEGYFVVYPDPARDRLYVEHYRNDGTLHAVIEGQTAAELYGPAVERGLVSRLEHAAYLGRELARAEHALRTGEPFVQDGAPEQPRVGETGECGCGP